MKFDEDYMWDDDSSVEANKKKNKKNAKGGNSSKSGKSSSSSSEAQSTISSDYLAIKQTFERFDTNKQGKIETKQLKFAMRALGLEPKKEEIKRLSEEHSKDGFILEQDFVDLMMKRFADKSVNEEIIKAFQLFDSGHTGKITFNDLKRVSNELGEKISDEELWEMIEEADLNGDREVDCHEFLRIMQKTCLY